MTSGTIDESLNELNEFIRFDRIEYVAKINSVLLPAWTTSDVAIKKYFVRYS